MSTLSTHVLDASIGVPAAGMTVVLVGPSGEEIEAGVTDTDGRIAYADELEPDNYGLIFDTGAWFAAAGRDTFYPEVPVSFTVEPGSDHLHVPLLLSPYSYTTYRGS